MEGGDQQTAEEPQQEQTTAEGDQEQTTAEGGEGEATATAEAKPDQPAAEAQQEEAPAADASESQEQAEAEVKPEEGQGQAEEQKAAEEDSELHARIHTHSSLYKFNSYGELCSLMIIYPQVIHTSISEIPSMLLYIKFIASITYTHTHTCVIFQSSCRTPLNKFPRQLENNVI